ncbi:unnamed protein product [Peronospora belbahrii]|uniref:Uncharacterized protein n=1 Tax=Peronospora belbahrii TaxID=622444 RepID=A0AAU9KJQ5_9STRA|nr:unnamed protein product [Peronospora belbahrii]CAH0474274.1 unnamed protein product [Peronospora belbahrii]
MRKQKITETVSLKAHCTYSSTGCKAIKVAALCGILARGAQSTGLQADAQQQQQGRVVTRIMTMRNIEKAGAWPFMAEWRVLCGAYRIMKIVSPI